MTQEKMLQIANQYNSTQWLRLGLRSGTTVQGQLTWGTQIQGVIRGGEAGGY